MTADAQPVAASAWSALARHARVIAQLALALAVVRLYEIEGEAFSKLMGLAAAGFLASIATPRAQRLRLFGVLSAIGIVWVLGPLDGAWLLALGLSLIAIAHLPLALAYRALLLVAVGGGLAALRAGVGATPWSGALWPILGSMFMFRMVLYLRAPPKDRAEGGLWAALAYFFMLPNVAFPLFPVVDFQTFRRTHFDRDEDAIYAQGMLWIARGLLHLVLYRFVYHHLLGDPADVVSLGDLVQYMLATFLLYLRVSGQFHVIVGLLHLFGFRLPETHKLYYLAHSFTELWRRINIYWTDFMMKTVFYPAYFRVKRFGPSASFALATGAVFATTWLLHSYQWFWLRGGFPLTAPDLLFWAILGALVVRGGLRELHAKKAPRRPPGTWSRKLGLQAAATFAAFCFLWSLWSAQSVGQWLWMLGAAAEVDLRGIALLAGTLAAIAALGGWDWSAPGAATSGWRQWLGSASFRTFAPLGVLLVIGLPAVQDALPPRAALTLSSLQSTQLNAQDAALQHRGYYEQLDVRGRADAAAVGAFGIQRADWKDPAAAGIIRERRDRIGRDLQPSLSISWNGTAFSTNEFGMRDRPYTRAKPPGTLRIALLGPSHVMGNGVSDGETFEGLVEERLNRELGRDGRRFEILNFGIDGFTLPQQLALLEERVFDFAPDLVLITQYEHGQTMTERYLLKVVGDDISVEEGLQALLERAGLGRADHSGLPVPFAPLRAAAEAVGLDVRMPWAEATGRAHRIAVEANGWAIGRISEVARTRGVQPVVLALNAVINDAPEQIPNLVEIHAAGLPVIDLFDVFPEAERASLRVAPWDDHPNPEGHRRIAERLYPALLPFVTQISPRDAQKVSP